MKILSFYLIWLCCLISCNQNTENGLDTVPRIYNDRITLIPLDTLVIPLSSRSNVYSNYVKKCLIKGKPYLGVVNENTNELEFYHLADPKGNFKIAFQEDGPNGINQIRAFEIMSDSTLLIGSNYRLRLYVSDLNGNILRILNTHGVERKDKPYVPIYYSWQPLVYNKAKNDFYVFTRVDTDYDGPGIWSGTMFLKIPDFRDELSKHVFELPSYFNDFIHGAFFSHSSHVVVNKRNLVLGLPFYNDLLIYDMDNGTIHQRAAGSRHFGDALPWDNPTMDGHEEFYLSSNSYRELAYDEENKLLYRLAYRAVDYVGPDGQRRNWDNKPPSVIILDEDFEKMGEVDLPQNTYYTRSYFTHQGRFYLSLNHPDNDPSEDRMVFVGFKPTKL